MFFWFYFEGFVYLWNCGFASYCKQMIVYIHSLLWLCGSEVCEGAFFCVNRAL
jgi:hypothetical protein